jgi:lipopolysaccharide export system protein LptA
MRSLRWLLLIAIAVISAGVFQVYRLQRIAGKTTPRPAPPPLALADRASAFDWEWGQSDEGKPALKLSAKKYRLTADSKIAELENIELRIYQKNGQHFDRVRTDHAQFSTVDNKLFAPGEAEITLDVPVAGEPPSTLTTIRTSAVNFDNQTGQAFSDQHVTFAFASGTGICDGASYNPQTHEIHLLHGVVLNLKSRNPKGRAMKVEAEELLYNETDSTVKLAPWAKMTRDQTVLVAGTTTVKLRERKLDSIEAPLAHGTDKQAGRNLDYSADLVKAQYNEDGEMEKLEATGNAKLISHTKASDTTMTAGRLNLSFTTGEGDSVLSSVQARGNAFLESKPIPDPKLLTADTKDMHADSVDLFMKPDGRELDRANTLSPGTLDFIPNQNSRSRRVLKADRMQVTYGADNEIKAFHADTASTETHPSKDEIASKKKLPGLLAVTSSKTLDAAFDDAGQLKQIQQAGNFRYSEGVRKAQADTAVMDNAKNVMDLDSHAHVSDDAGSTAANHIRLDQATDEFDARGNVATTRLPDSKPGAKEQSGMLDPGEATNGKADHLISSNHGRMLHYVDNAVVWQGASKILADRIDIDRDQKSLTAEGHVISQLQDSPAAPTGGKTVPPVTTLVRAQKMVYTDANRLAVYSGGVTLLRAALNVKSATLQAFLNDGKPVDGKTPDSRIDYALADGKVEMAQSSAGRQRIGTGEHGEYYTNEGKITLTGGRPYLKDSLKGDATGEKLTYFTDDERLLIDGAPKKQVEGHIAKGKS